MFTFIDLFCGIGGFRLGLERLGGKCVLSCEKDKNARITYETWHGEIPHPDVMTLEGSDIPDHDILCAGFPCQPFSAAGKQRGMDDPRGLLFEEIIRIAREKRPKVLFLENVPRLLTHDKGNTWRIIKTAIEDLGYHVYHRVFDARCYVPQKRKRVYIVAFKDRVDFTFPDFQGTEKPLRDILEPNPDPKYTYTDDQFQKLEAHKQRHIKSSKGGFGYEISNLDRPANTLLAMYKKGLALRILIPQENQNPRLLTPREAARVMGFPDDLPIVVSDNHAYHQFGNAVIPPVIEAIGREIVKSLSGETETFKLKRPSLRGLKRAA